MGTLCINQKDIDNDNLMLNAETKGNNGKQFKRERQPSRAKAGRPGVRVSANVGLQKPNEFYKKQLQPGEGEDFADDVFPSGVDSICFVDKTNPAAAFISYEDEVKPLEKLKWRKCHEIFGTTDFKLYDKLEIEDIHQGQLGNCYFLSAVSALAEFPERFDAIFCGKNSSSSYYPVKMYIQGKPKTIFVNNEFPAFETGTFAFSHAGAQELWVPVLEKAWAKINRSYCMTIAGLPSEALDALTNAPTFNYIHKKYKADKMWEIIKHCDEQRFTMCTSCDGAEEKQANGLVAGHAYSLIEAREFSQDSSVRLVKLRNPWGEHEWKGDYSDESDLWTEEMKEEFQLEANTNDGEFWMHFNDFVKLFSYTFVCKYHSDYQYTAKKFTQNPPDSFCCKQFHVGPEGTHVYLTLHQKQARFYSKVQGYKPQMARIILAKYDPLHREYTFVGSDSSNNEKLNIEADLEEGEYHIFSKVNWPYEQKCSVVISFYSKDKIEFEAMSASEVSDNYLGETLEDFADRNGTKIELSNDIAIYHCLTDTDTGYYIINFKNSSKTKAYNVSLSCSITDNVNIVQVPGITAVSQGDNQYSINVSLNPEEDNVLLFEMKEQPWKCKVSNLGNFSYERCEIREDDSTKAIIKAAGRDNTLEEIEVTDSLVYKVLEKEEEIYLVFFNNGEESFRVDLEFTQLVNMGVDGRTPEQFLIRPGGHNHVRLNIEPEQEEFSYDFNVKYAQV